MVATSTIILGAFAVVAVVAVGVVIYELATEEKPQQHRSRGGKPRRRRSPSPSPIRSTASSGKCQSRGSTASYSRSNSTQSLHKCKTCEDRPSVTIHPCYHSSLCTDCFTKHLDSDPRCPDCKYIIISCRPQSKTQGSCKDCRKFSNLMLIQPCGHATVCSKCFDKHLESSSACPHCGIKVQSCRPQSSARGKCNLCEKFSLLRQFQPCGHYSFCGQHAEMFIDESEERCFECGNIVTEVL